MNDVTTFRAEQWLPYPRPTVFRFFSDAYNLENLTPPWLRFVVLTPRPITMRAGLRLDYQLKIHGVPARWQSEITAWEPEQRFVDEQRRGPYALWHHEHTFEQQAGGTLCRDVVRYAAPGGPLRHLIERFFVRGDIERIFAFRRARLEELLSLASRDGLPNEKAPTDP